MRKVGRVAITGGSAVFGQGCESDSETFCAQLAAGGKYDVLNAGCIANLSGQELGCLAHYLMQHQPDIVVAFTGWNDMYARLWDDIPHATDPGVRNLQDNYRNWLRITDRNAAIFARYRAALAWGSPLAEYVRWRKSVARPRERTPSALARRYAVLRDEFLDNLRVMSSITRGGGAKFLVVMQPELGGKARKSEAEIALRDGIRRNEPAYADDFAEYYRRLCGETSEQLSAEGIRVVNGATLLGNEPSTCFRDFVHYSADGHRRLAEKLALLLTTIR